MIPTHFPEANTIYTKPESMTDEQCGSLPVRITKDNRCVSCWQMQPHEIEDIIKTGKVYLHIWGGMPPAFIGTSPPGANS